MSRVITRKARLLLKARPQPSCPSFQQASCGQLDGRCRCADCTQLGRRPSNLTEVVRCRTKATRKIDGPQVSKFGHDLFKMRSVGEGT